ncbi:MAG: trypsin-like peptidase domain-containing protein [Akkermansiaceae bacterium]|nr:trypsin-like peptidase domain-containing protein [Akkermansiaceae bacterium]
MGNFVRLSGLLLLGFLTQACSVSPAPDPVVPSRAIRQLVAERASIVIVTDRKILTSWSGVLPKSLGAQDADAGSVTPISADGYFMTADHVLMRSAGRNVFIISGQSGRSKPEKARIVWRSKSSDLALLHIPRKTPYYYEWTPPDRWLPAGTSLIHGGVSTGARSAAGKLVTQLPPEGAFTGARQFKIDIPLRPGDSGGPIVDAYGRLVGINSAVEFLIPMETPFLSIPRETARV